VYQTKRNWVHISSISQEINRIFERLSSLACTQQPDTLSYAGPDQSKCHYNTQCLHDISTAIMYEVIFSYLEENTLHSEWCLLNDSLNFVLYTVIINFSLTQCVYNLINSGMYKLHLIAKYYIFLTLHDSYSQFLMMAIRISGHICWHMYI